MRWTEATGVVELGVLPGGATARSAAAVSGDGSVIVGGTSTFEAFRWTASDGAQPLGGGGSPTEISDDGQVVVGSVVSPVPPVFGPITLWARWTEAGGWQALPELTSGRIIGSIAHATSADGSMVVGRTENAPVFGDAAWWSEPTGTESLGLTGGNAQLASQAVSVSADGRVIVGSVGAVEGRAPQSSAFIWDSIHGVRFVATLLTSLGIDLTGWTLTEATDISDDGLTIVGNGTFREGNVERTAPGSR